MATEKRLIDANALIDKAYWHGEPHTYDCFYPEGTEAVDVDDIENAPTVDAVEVVRCKDCRFYRKPFCILNDNKNGWLNHELPEHFCSHGERETDG